jgi:mRNA turnover protein 4
MQKALGTCPSSSISSSHLLSPYLSGNTGLLITSTPISELQEFFDNFVKRDYLRAGAKAPETVVIGQGALSRDGLPLPNNMEPLLRSLGNL